MQSLPTFDITNEEYLREITYNDTSEFSNVSEIVIKARELAYIEYYRIKDDSNIVSEFRFNPITYDNETYWHFVKMPKEFLSEVNKNMTGREFDKWANEKPIYVQTLIKSLS